jgi:hypothetical protein
MTPKRPRSITPIQALGMLNSPFIHRQSELFADRIRQEVHGDLRAQIQGAIELGFSRRASDEELERLGALVEAHGLDIICRAIFNSNEFIYLP